MNKEITILLIVLAVILMCQIPNTMAGHCGTSGVSLDSLLKFVGEGRLIQCCEAHDRCYETCGRTQAMCDAIFRSCLINQCDTMTSSLRRSLCKDDAALAVVAVTKFGSSAFNRAQRQSNCRMKWLQGIWTGRGFQNSGSSWTIRLVALEGSYQISYPSLNCGGDWRGMSVETPDKIHFREYITYGMQRCIQTGDVTLVKISADQVSFAYKQSDIEATGTLVRQP